MFAPSVKRFSRICSVLLSAMAASIAFSAAAEELSFSVSAKSVHMMDFEICDVAKGAVIQGNEGAQLGFMIYDAGGNLLLFEKSEDASARVRIDKIEQLECETFTLLVINQAADEASISFKLLRVREGAGDLRGGNGSDPSSSPNRFPRCPSSDPRCASL